VVSRWRVVAWADWPLAAAIALAVAAVAEAQFLPAENSDTTTRVVLNVAATAPLLLAGPLLPLAAGLVGAAMGGLLSLGTPPLTGLIGQFVAVLLVAGRYGRVATSVALLPLAGNVVYPYSGNDADRPLGLLQFCLGLAAAGLGDARRQRGHVIAERDATRREMALVTERSRIARELHDVVAHHVSMMVIRAETARVGTPSLPPDGQEALTAIGHTGRQALAEMRRLLGVLRAERDDEPPRAPQPTLDQLDDLVTSVAASGSAVRLRRDGRIRGLSPGVELAAYRIVQEALTNVRRHAPGADAEVVLRYGERALTVAVLNTGPPGPPGRGDAAEGHGLVGMRERAAMVGGALRAGPLDSGGFLVEAELPVDGSP
jgi:signal transduction histidine kinase